MYITEPPCGDASLLFKSEDLADFHWTGAKAKNQEDQAKEIGITWLKSGRSDI